MNTTTTALLIPATGTATTITLPRDPDRQLTALKETVGGYIEGIPVPHTHPGLSLVMIANTDGKSLGLPANAQATRLMQPGRWIATDDYLVGDVVICAVDTATGDDTGLPATVIEALTRVAAGA